MSFPSIWLLSSEVQHIIFKCQLRVPLHTGSTLLFGSSMFSSTPHRWCGLKYRTCPWWRISGGFASSTDSPNAEIQEEVLCHCESCWKKFGKLNILSRSGLREAFRNTLGGVSFLLLTVTINGRWRKPDLHTRFIFSKAPKVGNSVAPCAFLAEGIDYVDLEAIRQYLTTPNYSDAE